MTCVLFVGSRVLAVCKGNLEKQTRTSVIMRVNYRSVFPLKILASQKEGNVLGEVVSPSGDNNA
jgi:hypothetical protein